MVVVYQIYPSGDPWIPGALICVNFQGLLTFVIWYAFQSPAKTNGLGAQFTGFVHRGAINCVFH
jgi:hypothetical protein